MNLKTTIMNKKNLLLLFVGILFGTFFAYAGDYLASKPKSPQKASKNNQTNLLPPCVGETGMIKNKDNSTVNPFFAEEEFMECLYRYSRMTPEEIRKEYLKLNKNYNSNSASHFETAKIEYLAIKWGRSSPREALEELNENFFLHDSFIRLVMKDWVKRDQETALAYIIENKNSLAGSYTVDILASHAPLELIKWINSAPQGNRNLILISAIDALPAEKMAALVSGMGKCDTMDDWEYSEIASKWAKIDLDASVQWVNSLDHLGKEAKEKILQMALSQLPPDKALSEMDKKGLVDKIPSLAVIADSLSKKSPEKALDWFLSQVTDEQIQACDERSLPLFINAYNPQMVSHAQQLPPGKKKDAVLEKMATEVRGDWRSRRECDLNAPSLDKRMELAAQISTQDNRDATIQRILEEHISSKPKKVMEWVEQSSLPAEKKQQYINQCKMSIKRAEMPYLYLLL